MTRGRRGWTLFAALMPLTAISLIRVLRDRVGLAAAWPLWRSTILDLTLLMGGAVLVAGVAFGVHAWRDAKRMHHA